MKSERGWFGNKDREISLFHGGHKRARSSRRRIDHDQIRIGEFTVHRSNDRRSHGVTDIQTTGDQLFSFADSFAFDHADWVINLFDRPRWANQNTSTAGVTQFGEHHGGSSSKTDDGIEFTQFRTLSASRADRLIHRRNRHFHMANLVRVTGKKEMAVWFFDIAIQECRRLMYRFCNGDGKGCFPRSSFARSDGDFHNQCSSTSASVISVSVPASNAAMASRTVPPSVRYTLIPAVLSTFIALGPQ